MLPHLKRIEIVDNDTTILQFMRRALDGLGCNTCFHHCPVEALECLKSNKGDILLTDYEMPKMEGPELIARAKSFLPNLISILMTGNGILQPMDSVSLMSKPFSKSVLVDMLTSALANDR